MSERRKKWEEYPDIMTTADLQEIMGVSKETALKMIHQQGFPKLRVSGGRKYLYVKSALQQYFHEKAISA